MKPTAFEYLAPETCDEALEALAAQGDEAAVLAGGQSLIPMMNLRIAAPWVLVDIMRIAELRDIGREPGWIEIGAGVSMARAEREAGVPLLTAALRNVGHPPIRNRGTVCGSVAHADPSAEVPAVLLALDGEVVLQSERGRRVLSADDFFRSYFTTAREPTELVVAVRIPATGRRTAFLEVTPRASGSTGEFATVAVAATADRDDDGRLGNVALAFAGAAERPIRAREAEAIMSGTEPTPEAIATAADAAAHAVDPPADVHAGSDYRRRLVHTLTARALTELAA